jgi:Tfp pilus assembly protein PilF
MLITRFRISVPVMVLLAMLCLALALGPGCNTDRAAIYTGGTSDFTMRPATDTARLLHNAHYFKLMGRTELALKELEEAYQRDPGNLKVAGALAEGYEQLGHSERAQQIYQEVLARYPDHQALANNLGFSYYQSGNWKAAEDCFRQALSQNPNNAAARNNLGLLLCRQGRQEEARRLWQETEGTAAAEQKLAQVATILGPASSSPDRLSAAAAKSPVSQPAAQTRAAPAEAARPSLRGGPTPGAARATPAGAMDSRAVSGLPDRSGEPLKETAAPPLPPTAAGQKPPVKAEPASNPGIYGGVIRPPAAVAAKPTPEPALAAATEPPESRPAVAAAVPAQAPPPKAAPSRVEAPKAVSSRPLTTAELEDTGIEVKNGNGVPDLARHTRSLLDLEGFNVVAIANHLDFGMERTVILCRPGAERVAEALRTKFFHGATVEPWKERGGNADADIRIILGHDLSRSFGEETAQGDQD